MQSAIPNGTVLQTRYRILSILGHGGFGRTYLAEDQGRFNELCALKELTPPSENPYALDKSKELFQREAQILYQIQHPQIPQFRATFEDNQRLFLVQDYVEGKTYRTLLDERKAQGYVFSENEVHRLVTQVLPVLAYLHGKGIIHRDIAPDNIMLRDRDQLPVLIDFGVVKELATRIQGPETVRQQTTVGKLGYAPTEQMQTGRAYPNSDLYALAVTAVVLLTGREPQDLFDENNMTWRWQRYVQPNPVFAQVLNRMLSYRVGDRFQSANEVMQALQGSGTVAPYPATQPIQTQPIQLPQPPVPQQPPVQQPPQPAPSSMETIAIGRRSPDTETPTRFENNAQSTLNTRSSLWDDPWAVLAIVTGLALLMGLSAWTITRFLTAQPTPAPTVSPTVSPSASPTPPSPRPSTPSPSPSAEPTTFSQTLNFSNGTESRDGTLRSNETLEFLLNGQEGQQFNSSVQGEDVVLSVLGPNRQAIDNQATRVSNWSGTLPYSGRYIVQLNTRKGIQRGNFKFNATLKTPPSPSPSPSASPSPSPSPSPTPTIQTERFNIPSGRNGAQVAGRVGPSVTRRYIVNARGGQTLTARLNGGTLTIRYPDGQVIEGGAAWQSALPVGGDYQVDVTSNQETDYTLDINVQ